VYFPLLLQRKDTKGKQPGKPFCRKVSRDSSKEEGHLRTKRRKCFLPTTHKKTTRLPNGGSFGFILVPASQPHGRLLSAAVKRFAPTKRPVRRGDLAGGDSHRITAIRKPIRRWDALAHFRKLVFVQSARGTDETQKAAPQDACVHRGGVMNHFVRGKHLRLFVRKCPSLFGRVARPLFRKKGVSGCFPLVPFLCRSKGKYTPKQAIQSKQYLYILKTHVTPHAKPLYFSRIYPSARVKISRAFSKVSARRASAKGNDR